MNNNELFPSLTEEIPRPTAERVAECIDCANSLMIRIIQNEKIDGKKKKIGPGILKNLHQEVLDYYPGWAGKFRVSDDVRVGGRKLIPVDHLEDYAYKFERWLEEEVDNLRKPENHENIQLALRIASAAHYAVVGELHPFDDGNGRVARVLMNGILMMNTKEGHFYNYYISPIPLVREPINVEEIKKILMHGKEPKVHPYLKALRAVDSSWALNPFEVYIASKWIDSINSFLNDLEKKYKKTSKDKKWKHHLGNSARSLVDKFSERRLHLFAFIEDNRAGRYVVDKVPDFYAPTHPSFKIKDKMILDRNLVL